MTLTIKTNNVPRPIIRAWVLTNKEREEFDYLDWAAIDDGRDDADFFRYKGQLYDLGEFMRTPNSGDFDSWDGYRSDSFFSGLLVKFANDFEDVIVGRYCS